MFAEKPKSLGPELNIHSGKKQKLLHAHVCRHGHWGYEGRVGVWGARAEMYNRPSRSQSCGFSHSTTYMLKPPRGRKSALHLVTRSFLATLPRNSYFLLRRIGLFHVRALTCGFPADRELCNGWYAPRAGAAAPNRTCHIQNRMSAVAWRMIFSSEQNRLRVC